MDRIQLVASDAAAVAETFGAFFGVHALGEDDVPCLGARRTTLRAGASIIEVLVPAGEGAVSNFAEQRHGGGLFAGGFATSDIDALQALMEREGIRCHRQGDQVIIEPTPKGGLRAIFTQEKPQDPEPEPTSILRHIYEVTNPVKDLEAATDLYTRAFGLDPSRYHPISSKLYAYTGTLTLLDPPRALDRIEVTQTYDEQQAMGRFYARNGESLYMCFGEVDDFDALVERLERYGARYAIRDPNDHAGDPNVLFIHPKSLHGMLMGISAKDVAWEWSANEESRARWAEKAEAST